MQNKLRFYQHKKHFRNGGAFFLIIFDEKIVEFCRMRKNVMFFYEFTFILKKNIKIYLFFMYLVYNKIKVRNYKINHLNFTYFR